MMKQKEIEQMVSEWASQASKIIPLVWPLERYIASNPLEDLQDLRFEDAIKYALEQFSSQKADDSLTQSVNRELIKWCQAFLDKGQAPLSLPYRKEGFYQTWVRLALYDKKIHCRSKSAKRWLSTLPLSPFEAIKIVIKKLRISDHKAVDFLRFSLAQLPGWAGYFKWMESQYSDQSDRRAWLIEFLAVRLCITWSLALAKNWSLHTNWTELSGEFDQKKFEEIKLAEKAYHEELLGKISRQPLLSVEDSELKKEAQFIFCIDIRSESIRKEIEQVGPYETYGAPGFFNLPISIKSDLIGGMSTPSCPVLIKPQHEVQNRASSAKSPKAHFLSRFKRFYHALKYNFVTPFILAEMLGGLVGLWAGAYLLAPQRVKKIKRVCEKMGRFGDLRKRVPQITHTIPLKEQVLYANSLLKLIGLTKNFSPYVVVCGHASMTENNPYASALECGACGGRGGGSNASLLAEILNCVEVRKGLARKGIQIPSTTLFVAAEHNTTTDSISFYGQKLIREKPFTEIEQKVKIACSRSRRERANRIDRSLGQTELSRCAFKRSVDWSETRPEWGLAGNAAFVIGKRELTKGVNLDDRSFLHSYDHQQDFFGKELESILLAPVLVAQSINTHYFFSSFLPTLFGSGSKITQNIVGKMGVMQGNGSDLMFGLPVQSVKAKDNESFHAPMRLLVVIQAPVQRIEEILKRHQMLNNIFSNQWGKLAVVSPEDQRCYQRSVDGQWNPV